VLIKFWEGISSKLSERWAATVVTPAFLFWTGGLAAWLWRKQDSIGELETWFNGLSNAVQLTLVVGALLLVTLSASLVQRFDLTVLRALEGYWPRWLNRIRGLLVSWQSRQLEKHNIRFQELAGKAPEQMSREEKEEYVEKDLRLMRAPTDPALRMPTKLGNLLRAAETHSRDRYGLDAVVCWPRLWLLLPDGPKKELQEARARLDDAVRVVSWGMLFFVWASWAWWALPVALLVSIFAYLGSLRAADLYSELLKATFDLHRMTLYEGLRWPTPANPADERNQGEALTKYLWRGSDETTPAFTADNATGEGRQ
jgi:hypothetical protein